MSCQRVPGGGGVWKYFSQPRLCCEKREVQRGAADLQSDAVMPQYNCTSNRKQPRLMKPVRLNEEKHKHTHTQFITVWWRELSLHSQCKDSKKTLFIEYSHQLAVMNKAQRNPQTTGSRPTRAHTYIHTHTQLRYGKHRTRFQSFGFV